MIKTGSIEITTVVGCPMKCRYCPQDSLLSAYGDRDKRMTLDMFKACIDKVPSSVRIDFSGMAEPWLNQECTAMIVYAHQKGHPLAVYTTLVGMSLEDWNSIKHLEFEKFNVHVADEDGLSRIPITNSYVTMVQTVAKEGVKGCLEFTCHGKPHNSIESAIPPTWFGLDSRCGLVAPALTKSGPIQCKSCGLLLNRNVLFPDGTLALCCMDYGMKHIIGNLFRDSYEGIMSGLSISDIRERMESSDGEVICRYCSNSISL